MATIFLCVREQADTHPLDAELSLGTDRYSDLLRETLDYLGVYVPYNKAVEIFKRILKLGVSTRVQQQSL